MTAKDKAYKDFLKELRKISLTENLKDIKDLKSLNESFNKYNYERDKEYKSLNENNMTFGLMNYIMESKLEELLKNKKNIIKEYVDIIHNDNNLASQFLFINSLHNYSLVNESKNYINETLSLISKKLNRKNINESNKKLYNFFKKNNLNAEVDENIRKLYENCDFVIKNNKKVSNLNDINKSINEIANYIEEHKKTLNESATENVSMDNIINEYNMKYSSELNDEEKELIKEIFSSPEQKTQRKESLFNNLKNECIEIVNNLINEETNDSDKEGLITIKEGIIKMQYQNESLVKDIAKLLEMREVLSEK